MSESRIDTDKDGEVGDDQGSRRRWLWLADTGATAGRPYTLFPSESGARGAGGQPRPGRPHLKGQRPPARPGIIFERTLVAVELP